MMVLCGQFSRGEVGPNTAMLLGQYTLCNFSSLGDIQHIEQTLHIEMPGEVGIFFARGRKYRCQHIDLGYILTDHLHMQHFLIHHVEAHIRPRAFEQIIFFPEVRSHHTAIAKYFP